MRLAAFLIPLAFATSLTAMPAMAQEGTGGTISIQGHGEITARPDTAFVTSGVTSQGATAKEALDANSKDMAALIETLKAAGIEARDIQTSGFSVNPNYVYTDQRDANGYTLPPKINGYQVTNSVTVRVRDLAKLGPVLDQAVTVGANTINGVSFSVDDTSDLLDEARKSAFADARHKAELYAGLAGSDLGGLVSISETQGSYAPPMPYMMKQAAVADAAAVPVEVGELSFSVDVTVTWTLDQ